MSGTRCLAKEKQGKRENEIASQFHGGFYTPMEFVGDASAID